MIQWSERMVHITAKGTMAFPQASWHSHNEHLSSSQPVQSQCVGVAAPLLSTSHHLHQPTQLKCTDRVSVLTCPVCLPCVDQLSWFASVLPWSEGTHLARGDKLGLKECACPEEHSPVLHLLKKRKSDLILDNLTREIPKMLEFPRDISKL